MKWIIAVACLMLAGEPNAAVAQPIEAQVRDALTSIELGSRCAETRPVLDGAEMALVDQLRGKIDAVQFQEDLSAARSAAAAAVEPDVIVCWRTRGTVDQLLDAGSLTEEVVTQAYAVQAYQAGGVNGVAMACRIPEERTTAFRGLVLSILGRRLDTSYLRVDLTTGYDRQRDLMRNSAAARLACPTAERGLAQLELRYKLRADRLVRDYPGFRPGIWFVR